MISRKTKNKKSKLTHLKVWLILVVFFMFSLYLMNKSFGYNSNSSSFRIARHQVGDFGLHLSLIRSVSWGSNIPPQSPFFPGRPLPYHYYFDFAVGLLEKAGMRIDYAVNGLSAIGFTFLLYEMYSVSQTLFGKNIIIGLLPIILFLFNSSLSFFDFLKNLNSESIFTQIWYLPDYIHKGPFDGSLISIYFTLNVFLNQRHLILGLALSLFIIHAVLKDILNIASLSRFELMMFGILLGLSSRIHSLVFISSCIVIFSLFISFKKIKHLLYILFPALVIFSFHLKSILLMDIEHPIFHPGFIIPEPATMATFFSFWVLNLGFSLVTVSLGVILSKKTHRVIFLNIFLLFILGNIFQFSYRIEHNHSMFNYFLIIANMYSANSLFCIYRKNVFGKIISLLLLIVLTCSGILNFMAVKNDFQLLVKDAPSNKFMEWLKNSTEKNAVFVSKKEILDPITLAGRMNYLGHDYYTSVMGYNRDKRENNIKSFYSMNNVDCIVRMKNEGISYIVVPKNDFGEFEYFVNIDYMAKYLKKVYEEESVTVFKI